MSEKNATTYTVLHLRFKFARRASGVQEKLANGGRVADVGCGHGASAIRTVLSGLR